MRIAYIGNFEPEHSTENHVRQALQNNGHEVVGLRENSAGTWSAPCLSQVLGGVGLVLWTRTGWDWEKACGWSWQEAMERQYAMLRAARVAGVPVVGYHLDRWWGLSREHQVRDEAFFRVDLLVTADGGHDAQWADAGVDHAWLPPGVLRSECERAAGPEAAERYKGVDVAFVGSFNTYHAEWLKERRRLVEALMRRYRRRFRLVQGGLRGQGLADLYQTVPVIVGDSCLSGDEYQGPVARRYWSDRVPETLGRGGYLLHPAVEGMDEWFDDGDGLFVYAGPHHYPLGDPKGMLEVVENVLLSMDYGTRGELVEMRRAHVMEHHTYERRMEQLVDVCKARGLL